MAMDMSSPAAKRRKLEQELMDTDFAIKRKRQEIVNATTKVSLTTAKLASLSHDIEATKGFIKDATRLVFSFWGKRSRGEEWSKVDEEMLKKAEDREEMLKEEKTSVEAALASLEKERNDAQAIVEALQKELDILEEQQKDIVQHSHKLQPDPSEYFRAVVKLGAPSELTSYRNWWRGQKLDQGFNPLFLCFVPPEAQPRMPVELAEEVFSQFLVDAYDPEAYVVDERDCEFTVDLCYLVGGSELLDEREMATKFRVTLSHYLGTDLRVEESILECLQASSKFTTDGCVFISGHMRLLAELKLHPKTALFQAMQYYSIYLASMRDAEREKSFWPCFLVELVGTCIRISGLVYDRKVTCQPLTPFLHCYVNYSDKSGMTNLCRVMRALRTGVHKLQCMGAVAGTRNKNIPYRLCQPDLELQTRIADKLMFVMTAVGTGESKVVKFCRRYGEPVHKAWAARGLAPKLLKAEKGRDGWYMIEMEYLDPAEWKSVLEWSNASQTTPFRDDLMETISNALAEAHAILVDGRKTVHGDSRSPNIVVKERDEGGFEVKFLDFDWSGIDEQTLYPAFINMDIEWHADVGPGAPLRQEHDKHCVGALFKH